MPWSSRGRAVLVFILLVLCANIALADEDGSIVLRSGERFDSVMFSVDKRFKIVTIDTIDGERKISFSHVQSIIQNGEDVTATLLGRAPAAPTTSKPKLSEPESAPPPDKVLPKEPTPTQAVAPTQELTPTQAVDPTSETVAPEATGAGRSDEGSTEAGEAPQAESWLSEQDESYKAAHAPLFQLGLRAAGNFSIPMGDYYEGIDAGLGFDVDMVTPINHVFALRFSGSKSGMKVSDDMVLVDLNTMQIIDADLSLAAWRLTVGGQALWPLDKERPDASHVYVYTGLGIVMHRFTFESFTGTNPPADNTDTQTKFLTNYGVGIVKMLSPTMGIDANANFDLIFLGSNTAPGTFDIYPDVSYATIFDLKLGVLFVF